MVSKATHAVLATHAIYKATHAIIMATHAKFEHARGEVETFLSTP